MCGHPLNRLDSSSETLCIYLTTLSVTDTDTVTSNEWMAVGSELESTCKWLWLAARFCPCHCLERLGKTQNPRICGSRCRGRVLNQAELELKKGKDFPDHAMQTYRGSGGPALPICNLDSRWR